MDNKNTLRWLFCILALLFFILPVLLDDELSLLENWLFVFFSWFILIALSCYREQRNISDSKVTKQ